MKNRSLLKDGSCRPITVTYRVVRLALWACGLDVFCGCGVFQRYLRRLKLIWFPPAILDTGQGFKLVRS
ncbi:unnamed protein product [Arctogadus glacialis]